MEELLFETRQINQQKDEGFDYCDEADEIKSSMQSNKANNLNKAENSTKTSSEDEKKPIQGGSNLPLSQMKE